MHAYHIDVTSEFAEDHRDNIDRLGRTALGSLTRARGVDHKLDRLKDMYGSIHRENSKKQQKHERKRKRYSNRKFVLITTSGGEEQARYGQEDAPKRGGRNGGGSSSPTNCHKSGWGTRCYRAESEQGAPPCSSSNGIDGEICFKCGHITNSILSVRSIKLVGGWFTWSINIHGILPFGICVLRSVLLRGTIGL